MRIAIDAMAYGADSIGRVDGKTVFVAGGVPGDVVEAEIVSAGKTFDRARVAEVLEPSPLRIASRCPYASVCGGCPWSSMRYEAQLDAKRKNVCDALTRIGHLDPEDAEQLVAPVQSVGEPWGYRNKIELTASTGPRGMILGMHPRSEDGAVVPVDRCPLLPRGHQKLPRSVGGALRFLGGRRELGIERVGIRISERTGQIEVALWTDPAAFPRNEVAKVLKDAARPTSTVRVLVKEKASARKIAGLERLDGMGHWEERLAGGVMKISAPSFFQVNTAGADRLVQLVMEGLLPQPDDVAADLYCGAGTFTLPLARICDAVVAVESYGPAVRDLKRNIADEGLDDVVEAVGDDTARQLDALEDVDLVVVDPPRAGLERSVVEALSECEARRVAYVSCDPTTLARDLGVFAELGSLAPAIVTPVDLFPQTYHVETVTILERV